MHRPDEEREGEEAERRDGGAARAADFAGAACFAFASVSRTRIVYS